MNSYFIPHKQRAKKYEFLVYFMQKACNKVWLRSLLHAKSKKWAIKYEFLLYCTQTAWNKVWIHTLLHTKNFQQFPDGWLFQRLSSLQFTGNTRVDTHLLKQLSDFLTILRQYAKYRPSSLFAVWMVATWENVAKKGSFEVPHQIKLLLVAFSTKTQEI